MASIACLPIAAISNCICSLFGSCCARTTHKILCTNFTFTHRNSSYIYYLIAVVIAMCSFATEHYGGDIVLGGRTMRKVSERIAQLTNNDMVVGSFVVQKTVPEYFPYTDLALHSFVFHCLCRFLLVEDPFLVRIYIVAFGLLNYFSFYC